jgi:hypothetical protein
MSLGDGGDCHAEPTQIEASARPQIKSMDTSIITGNFTVEVKGELNKGASIRVGGSDEKPETKTVEEIIDESGVTYITQRDVLSAVYKDLLDKKQKRNELPYSDEVAGKFQSLATKELAPYGDFEVSVTEHVPTAEASPMVRATALIDTMLANADLEQAYRLAFGAQGLANADKADRDALIEFAHKSGLGIQPPRKSKAS